MEGFVFPKDLREGDLILVADEFELKTVLRAFHELGWTWVGGRDLISNSYRLFNVLGISVWDRKSLGWCDKSMSSEVFSNLYKRVFNASDIFPGLRKLAFDSSLKDNLPDVDLSEFL